MLPQLSKMKSYQSFWHILESAKKWKVIRDFKLKSGEMLQFSLNVTPLTYYTSKSKILYIFTQSEHINRT